MKDVYILGIESSCDESSVSIVKNGKEEVKTIVLSQIDIHKVFGGVVPEVASRHHVQNFTIIMEELFLDIDLTIEDISAIAVTYGPGLNGCLLVGIEFAKTLAFIYNKPLVPVNHMAGHIYASNLEHTINYPALSLVISGGHTDLVYIKELLNFKIIGSTLDDAVGECYDKVGKILGLDYPAGPILDKIGKLGIHQYELPFALNDNSYNFSFSGLKSKVVNIVHNANQRGEEIIVNNMAYDFGNIIVKILTTKTIKAIKDYNVKTLILAGGVSANSWIRQAFLDLEESLGIKVIIPQIKYCTDNATMIATVGYDIFMKGKTSDFTLNANPSLSLEDF